MGFPRLTLPALRQLARSKFAARLPGADASLRRSNLNVIADVMGGFVNDELGYIDYLATQIIPDTATDYLPRECALYQIDQEGPTFAAGNIVFAGIAAKDVPIGTVILNNGVQCATQADAAIGGGGTVSIAVKALTAGSAGNAAAGTSVKLVTAVPGVNGTATVDTGGLSGGTDAESLASMRARYLTRLRTPPQGGNPNDYVTWALQVPGVTRAWAYPLNRGPGTIDLTFVMDGRSNIIPLSGDVAAVQDYIGIYGGAPGVNPVTDDCVVFAPIATPLALTVHDLTPSNSDTEAAVAASFAALLQRVAIPGGAFTGTSAVAGLVAYADIDDAIEGAEGVTYHFLASPSADVTAASGHIYTPGTITYT